MKSAQAGSTLQVSVVHGDLNHTNHPILLGHYEGDTIAGAERVVDKMVVGALSQRYHLGCYPGRNGTAAVALAPSNEIQRSLGVQHGAIVIGLGKWGELTPSALTQAVSQGVIEYSLHIHQCHGAAEPLEEPKGLMINSLLIGSNTSANIAVEDSVNAIVRGVVLANRALAHRSTEAQGPKLPRVVHVQFIERLLDVAVEAAKAAHRVKKRSTRELQGALQIEPHLKKGKGGQTRLVPPSSKDYWRRWTISAVQDAPPPPPMSLPAVLKDRLRTVLQDDQSNDPKVYRALLDLALRDRDLTAPRPHKLRFLALSDRARAEATLQDNQSDLIEQLIQRSITTQTFDQDIAKTLFELLIPLDLKESLRSLENVVFILDNVTANYPWELISDADQSHEKTRPLCVRMGMIRQLQTVGYDNHARDTTSRKALVVGNPQTPLNYRDLPGAKAEAKRVAALLEQADYRTEYTPTRLRAEEVLNQLFAQPYRIIHIAGHGYYHEGDAETTGTKSGVVLSGGIFLTAAEIAQLDPIPELVFLNCCYLGQIDRTAPHTLAVNKLAASIAGELIRKGVRAVVAAGWPVEDEPALCFAESFYRDLLAGQSFGRALKEARSNTWKNFPSSNTCGAYQAYGDPDFCLTSGDRSSRGDGEDERVAAEEVLIQLDSLSAQLTDAKEATARERLSEVEQQCPSEWLKQGNVQERFGVVYGERKLFAEAVAHYEQALECEDASSPATLRAVEQWINLTVRQGEQKGDQETIKKAIDRGEHLLDLAKSPERLSIMGSAYKKLAQLEPDPVQTRSYLEQAAAYYQEAAGRQRQEGTADPYPTMNALVIEALLGRKTGDELEPLLAQCEGFAQQRFRTDRITWDAVTIADVALIRTVVHHVLPKEQERLVRIYRSVFAESSASQKEQNSALTQMKFLREMVKKVPHADRDATASAIEALDAIVKQLRPREELSASQVKPTSTGTSRQPRRSRPLPKQLGQKKPTRKDAGHRSSRIKVKTGKRRPMLS
jgi:CHAT domain-containing protein